MKNRISKNEAEILGVYFLMSNCRAVMADKSETLSDLDKELVSFVEIRAELSLPIFGAKKQALKNRREIARYTLQKFSDSFARKHYLIAREHLTDGVKSELSLFAGSELMTIAIEELSEVIDRMDNPFSKDIQPAEQLLNSMRMENFIKRGILAGLIEP